MTTRAGRKHLVAELVALLHDLDHGALLRVGRLREQRLVHVRIELALCIDLPESLLLQQVGKRAMHEPDAVLELRLFDAPTQPRAPARDRRGSGSAPSRAARSHARRTPPARARSACGSCRTPQRAAAGGRRADRGQPGERRRPERPAGGTPGSPDPLHWSAVADGAAPRSVACDSSVITPSEPPAPRR